MCELSLDTLPVELIYRIYDNLDSKTILFHVRSVCKRLYTIANNYNRYEIDFRSISMVDFEILCKMIDPLRVTKLILSNDEKTIGLIKCFLSKYDLKHFINIRHLILSHIEDKELEKSLKQIINLSINTLSIIKFDLYDDTHIKYEFLSKVITQPYLKKLDLEFRLADVKDFPWPNQSHIEYLRIGNVITFQQFYTILEQTPFLKTFILRDCSNKECSNKTSFQSPSNSFLQLTSLTFEQSRMNTDEFELILPFIPNLIYLKIIGNHYLANGSYLEFIIQKYLTDLNKFNFFFHSWENPTFEDFQTIIDSYQSPFWLEEKHWFINCDFIDGEKASMRVYSLPLCYKKFEVYSDVGRTSFTTYNGTDDSLMSMDSVQQLTVSLADEIPNFECNILETSEMFSNVTELKLFVNEIWPMQSINYLLSLINLSKLNSFILIAAENSRLSPQLIKNICLLVNSALNIRTLSLTSGQSPLSSKITLEQIFSMVPLHIKHLQVMVTDFDEIQTIIHKLQQLSSVTFQIVRVMARSFSENRPIITQIRQGSTCQKIDPYLQMWLGRPTVVNNE